MDPLEAAHYAGLYYISDTQPGIRRQRRGKGFRYLEVDGKPVRDETTLQRIRQLRIPPAWQDVWICERTDGHLQATGRDARGRKQYRYHEHWRTIRDATKYHRMIAFGEALPQIRARITRDLALPGLQREKVLATIIRLLESTMIRVGNTEYARTNRSYGLTTMRDRHVKIAGAELRFAFRGKSGKHHTISIHDRRLATIVKRCQDIPGYHLFQYFDAAGQRQSIDSADVNDYLRTISDQDFTAKDVRTWAGTVMAACALWDMEQFASETEAKRNIVQAIKHVASRLGNTPAICRQCYVHPDVIAGYLDTSLFEVARAPAPRQVTEAAPGLQPEEAIVLAFLRQRAAQQLHELEKTG